VRDGSLASPINASATLSPAHLVAITGSNAQNLRLTLNPSAGTFTGSFTHPVDSQKTNIKGGLYQHPGAPQAGGFFLGPVVGGTRLSGPVLLAPVP
jgi:hypothetical protein